MTVDVSTLNQYDGKQVILTTAAANGDAVEREGKVEAGSEVGLAFKEKGKRDAELVEPHDIVEIALAPEKPKTILQKKLKAVTETNVRQHLVDRHGMPRSAANKTNDEDGMTIHDGIDHSDLGHKHASDDDEENENGSEESSETEES